MPFRRPLCPPGTCEADPAKDKIARVPDGKVYIVGQCRVCGLTLVRLAEPEADGPKLSVKGENDVT